MVQKTRPNKCVRLNCEANARSSCVDKERLYPCFKHTLKCCGIGVYFPYKTTLQRIDCFSCITEQIQKQKQEVPKLKTLSLKRRFIRFKNCCKLPAFDLFTKGVFSVFILSAVLLLLWATVAETSPETHETIKHIYLNASH